jgi:signal transduction histidine kinase
MPPLPSFKSRLLRAFFLFSGLFILILVGFLFMTYQSAREEFAQTLFLQEIERWRDRRATDPDAPFPGGWVQAYAARDRIPEPWRSQLDRFTPEDDPAIPLREWREVQLWTGPVPGATEDVYLFADLRFAPGAWLLNTNQIRLVATAALLSLGFGYWLSRLVSARLARPLEQLQARIEAYEPGRTAPIAPGEFTDRELARLAGSFRDLHERINAFVRREQEFTRHASHELRTPITVIRTAGSVLQQHLDGADDRARRAVVNLIHAADDMTRLVNTFLWMAREEGEVERDDVCDAGHMLDTLCNHHRMLLRPGCSLTLHVEQPVRSRFPGPLFGIAAANLIGNAARHAGPGAIDVALHPDRLEVINPLPPSPPAASPRPAEPEPSGLGLRIVDRIATRCGWTWSSRPEPDVTPTRWRAVLRLDLPGERPPRPRG